MSVVRKRKRAPLPSQQELLRMFRYDPVEGRLWRVLEVLSKRRIAKNLGNLREVTAKPSSERVIVTIGRFQYPATQVIYKMVTGVDCQNYVRHLDGNLKNMKWDNLLPLAVAPPVEDKKANVVSAANDDAVIAKAITKRSINSMQRGTKLALKSGELISVIFAKFNEDDEIFEVVGRLDNGVVVTCNV